MSPKPRSKPKEAVAVEELTFEQAFAELEEIVEQLEAGQLSLDDSLARFERGQALAARCGALLEGAELKVQALLPRGDSYDLKDFDADEE